MIPEFHNSILLEQNKGMYVKKDHKVPMQRISEDEIADLGFIYCVLVQTYAIVRSPWRSSALR